ncbi:MAG: hypothetical protein QOC81_1791 [Thermoanaerobaculia bacterium]|jgi:uncharacterized repeat protein (TIGR01451 family)|nr:hypothetical protein [Thermoanaerobaculia bacterium]
MHNRLAVLAFFLVVLTPLRASAQSADLVVSKSGTESAAAGETIVYSIFAFNNGPSTAQNVTMTDSLPSGTTFVSLNVSDGPFTCSTPAVGSGGTVSCTAAAMDVEGTVVFTLSAKTSSSAPSGSITNTATISSSTFDPSPSDNSSSVTTGIAGASSASADLAIDSMDRSLAVTAGATVSFQVVIANKGPSTANHPRLTNAVPANTTFLSANVADPIGEFQCTTPAVGTSGNIVCTAAKFDLRGSGDQPVFTFTFRVNNGVGAETTLSDTASVSADENDPNTSNNTATRTTLVTSVAPSADVSVATTGGGATFSVVVRNAGPNDANNVTLTDNVPAGSTFASWTQNSGPAFTCNTPSPGASGTITCTISLLPGFDTKTTTAEFVLSLDTGIPVTNSASVSSSTPDPRPDNNTSSFPVSSKLSINDVTVTEGNSGTTPATFTVKLLPASGTLTATVDYQVIGVGATVGTDFVPNSGTLTFRAGETQKTITVAVIGDTLVENTETFKVQLTNPVNATFDDSPLLGSGVGTILDDDIGGPPAPGVRIGNVAFPEGNKGAFNVTFTATLSEASTTVSRVRWQTQDGTATAGQDYTASSGELVFQPGDLTKTFTVSVIGDGIFEPDEFFTIVIVSTDNTSVVPGPAATGIIINDDVKPPSRHRAVGH